MSSPFGKLRASSRTLLGNECFVFTSAVLLRVGLLAYGYWQDHFSALKYTDIDYFVFTDAARYVSKGQSPYLRDTYRYTPLLAWLLVPTSWSNVSFGFGKCLFAIGDIFTGYLTVEILRSHYHLDRERAVRLSTIWLLNPMVATISTRGSSEGLLAVMVVALLWAALEKKVVLAGLLLGLSVHLKIYPFVYAISIFWWMEASPTLRAWWPHEAQQLVEMIKSLATPNRLIFALSSAVVFTSMNVLMFCIYGRPFLEHTFFYHLVRTDHRHNFSPYSIMLYQQSATQAAGQSLQGLRPESLAFVPQLLLSALLIPMSLAPKDLPSTMLAQTFAFVSFNKVCTSQYFLWYMVLLPFYVSNSTFARRPLIGFTALLLWVGGQGLWLGHGFQLEFLGRSSFFPWLWTSSLIFFMINVVLLGIVIVDIRKGVSPSRKSKEA